MAAHLIVVRPNGLIADQLPCLTCTPAELCQMCQKKDLVVEQDGKVTDERLLKGLIDAGNAGQTDKGSDTTTELFLRGQIVLAKYGRTYFPAKIVGKDDVPSQYRKQLFQVVYMTMQLFIGMGNYRCIQVGHIKLLVESQVDSSCAAQSDILPLYNMALAELRNN